MKYILLIYLMFYLSACCTNEKVKQVLNADYSCKLGEMQAVRYESGQNTTEPKFEGIKNGFIILVDLNLKPNNFVSSYEDFLRKDAKGNYSSKPTKEQRIKYLKDADSVHAVNNKQEVQVWLINHSNKNVSIQMQDDYYICVLQAKAKTGKWLPVQYWRFSNCGLSYYNEEFKPHTANSFVTNLPNEGNFKTKLRFKLLGMNKFYYSNEFEGKINECEFVQNPKTYSDRRKGDLYPNYKLDSMIKLTRY